VHHPSSTADPACASRPSILGIWRLGQQLHSTEWSELLLAQPADALSSPRWDYVLKRGLCEGQCRTDQATESRQQIERFILAANAASHPNLIAVLDASIKGTVPYVVMPRLEGTTMAQLLDGAAPVTLPVALWWTRQAAQGLSALHSAGWVHQDVKPENMIVAPSGHVTVLDLGFAARVGEASGNTFRGSRTYASPEALAADGPAHSSRDIFALGRVLWSWVAQVETATDRVLSPVVELVEHMVNEKPKQRPTAEWVSRQLLKLEIETLGHHIGPTPSVRRAA
jgi:eukaryotic-like serine/threonine-protein kinase